MTTSKKQLLWSLLILTATLANINAKDSGTSFRSSEQDATITDTALDLSATSINPLSQLESALDKLNWDPETIANAAYEYWQGQVHVNLTQQWKNHQHQEVTILTTVCSYTAPYVLVPLMELETRPYHGIHLPKDHDLVVYHNIPRPPCLDAVPPAQSIRDFINSRPSNESIMIQIDLQEYLDYHSLLFHDHHFMIHSYDGKINLYHSWVGQFSLLTWMRESFHTRYPMDKETFLENFEKLLTMPQSDEPELELERDEAIWRIMGRTNTMEYYTAKTGETRVNDIVPKLLRKPFYAKLITHWPNAQKDIISNL